MAWLSEKDIRKQAEFNVMNDPNLSLLDRIGGLVSGMDMERFILKEEAHIIRRYHQKFLDETMPKRLYEEADSRIRNDELTFNYVLLEIDPNMVMPKEHKQLLEYFREG